MTLIDTYHPDREIDLVKLSHNYEEPYRATIGFALLELVYQFDVERVEVTEVVDNGKRVLILTARHENPILDRCVARDVVHSLSDVITKTSDERTLARTVVRAINALVILYREDSVAEPEEQHNDSD